MDKTFMQRHGYAFSGHLGEGSFARVVKAYSTHRKTSVAIKVVEKRKASTTYLEKFLPHEKKIVQSLKHPNVVDTLDVFQSHGGTLYMVMELCPRGDLSAYIRERGTLSEDTSRKLFEQLCLAVRYLHDRDVAHRDLKSGNLLLDVHYNLKVCDFGLSKTLTYDGGHAVLSETYCGTAKYAAPEVLRNVPYDPRVSDVWSMGVVLYKMLYGASPFKTNNVKKLVLLQTQHDVQFPDEPSVSTAAKRLIRGILHPDVKHRLAISSILQSEWIVNEGGASDGKEASTSGRLAGASKQ